MADPSPLAQASGTQRPPSAFSGYAPDDDMHTDARGSIVQHSDGAGLHETNSTSVSRSNTLKRQKSLTRKTSMKRSGSRKSTIAGSMRGVGVEDEVHGSSDAYNSVFNTPVPTTGNPTEILSNRFQAWRKFLKDLIAYFREIQTSYEHKSKALLKVSNVINNTTTPGFVTAEGGLGEANTILRNFHKQAVIEANRARDVENDIIGQLNGLRSDLGQKIKEIKSLSGDFKNSVEKEKDHSRRAVTNFQESLAAADSNPAALAGKDDPYLHRLNVERQIERQLDEENYLHKAYLNIEVSGRELESIVVGEVQKAYNALAGILKKEADEAYTAVESLRSGPVIIPRDLEWTRFVQNEPHLIAAGTPLRRIQDIGYPGKSHPSAAEVRAGMLERKSKYLKSYTPGWYVLSPTHLHEFKSADHIYSQSPVMSLLLSDQKLGSHSQPGSASHKFMLKGRQTGSMHRGHSWVFRAESYETMLAWFDNIRALTEKTGEERNAFVRKHARSFSSGSHRAPSMSGDSALDEDEADEVPFSANSSVLTKQPEDGAIPEAAPKRPQPGGRFPSDLVVNRHLQAPLSPSSGSSLGEQDLSTMAGGPQVERDEPFAATPAMVAEPPARQTHDSAFPIAGPTATRTTSSMAPEVAPPVSIPAQTPASMTAPATVIVPMSVPERAPAPAPSAYHNPAPYQLQTTTDATEQASVTSNHNPTQSFQRKGYFPGREGGAVRHDSNYGSWMAPVAAGTAVGVTAGVATTNHYSDLNEADEPTPTMRSDAADTEKVAVLPNAAPVPLINSTVSTRSTSDAAAPIQSQSTAASGLTDSPPVSSGELSSGSETVYNTNPDGSVNAKPTGHIFPTVLRHNTNTSISNLHVPGEFPKS